MQESFQHGTQVSDEGKHGAKGITGTKNMKKGFMDIPNLIFYLILIVLVIALMPGLVQTINPIAGQLNTTEPSFLPITLMPFIFFAAFLIIPLMKMRGG